MRRCEHDVRLDELYNTPWCDCFLCGPCIRGIVNSCPVCGLGRIVPAEPGGGPFPWQPFAILGFVAAAMFVMGWLAR